MRGPLVRLAACLLLASPLAACGQKNASATPEASTESETDRTADLAAFRLEFLGQDRSYSPEARAEAQTMLSALEQETGGLSDAAFELRLSEIVAKADNGHTLFFTGPWREKFNRIPVKFLLLDGRLYVGAADEPYTDIVGAEVMKIAGRDWPELRRELGRYQGGLDGWKAQFIQNFIESPAVLHAAGLNDTPDALALDIIANGNASDVVIEAGMFPAEFEGFEQYFPPARIVEFAREGDDEDQPLYLQNAGDLYRFHWLEDDVAYIQFKANAGASGDLNAVSFSADVLSRLEEKQPRAIILDQRFNPGGDLNNTRDLMQALPGLMAEGGKVYAITSGKTFSAGISSIGYLKQAGGDNVVIVGEPVGDRLDFWAEGGVMTLPQSGAMILYATERHDYTNGCPYEECHRSIVVHPIAVDSLQPDYLTPLTYDAYMAGRDPSMEKVMELIGGA